MVDKGKVVCHLFKETLGTELVCSILDPSTAFKPRSGERGKKSRSGSTLSMLRAGVRGSRRVDSRFAFAYTPGKSELK